MVTSNSSTGEGGHLPGDQLKPFDYHNLRDAQTLWDRFYDFLFGASPPAVIRAFFAYVGLPVLFRNAANCYDEGRLCVREVYVNVTETVKMAWPPTEERSPLFLW